MGSAQRAVDAHQRSSIWKSVGFALYLYFSYCIVIEAFLLHLLPPCLSYWDLERTPAPLLCRESTKEQNTSFLSGGWITEFCNSSDTIYEYVLAVRTIHVDRIKKFKDQNKTDEFGLSLEKGIKLRSGFFIRKVN